MTNPPRIILIDLDDTIYPASLGLWPLFTTRIHTYMRDRVGIPENEITTTRDRLFEQYGTTMRGLQFEHGIDMYEYLDFVHNIDLSEYVHPDPALTAVLDGLTQEKWIFTNASRTHAENILGLMGLERFFSGIIDVVDTAPWCKPQPEAFEIALHRLGNPNPGDILFVDDRSSNLDTARGLGMATCLISPEPQNNHAHIVRLAELGTLFS